jgi:hypothetical protein
LATHVATSLAFPKFRALDSDGEPLAGGKVYVYEVGSTTEVDTYPTYADATTQDISGGTLNTHPVILDADGEADIFVRNGIYKVVLKDSTDVLQWTIDRVPMGRASPFPAVTEWTEETTYTFTYLSGTSFQVDSVDATATYHVGRRIKTTSINGDVYSTITATAFATHTTVTVVNDSGTLDAAMAYLYYATASQVNPSHRDPVSFVSVIKNGDQTDFDPVAKVTAWTEQSDSLSEFATPTFTAKYPGKYLINLQIEFSDSGTDVAVTGYIYVNGSAVSQSVNRSDDTADEIKSMHLHHMVTLAAGGTVEAYVLGSGNTTVKGTSGTRLSVVRVG